MGRRVGKEELKEEFMAEAEKVFEEVMADKEEGPPLTLSDVEEQVGRLRFRLTSKLVEGKLKLEVNKQLGSAPNCQGCGRELRDKGFKSRQIITTQGEIELERDYKHCPLCRAGFFPPGPTVEDKSVRLE